MKLSYSTLLRRLRKFGLRRRSDRNSNTFQNTVMFARQQIENMLNGPESLSGYQSIWHTLQLNGVRIPRSVVQALLKEIDPEGTALRQRHRLRRRQYVNPGPNFSWHIDGYDKLKPWGFPIHGCIDGYSRRVLWLNVTRSNSSPDNIAQMYLNTVEELNGCPQNLITDLGTENAIAAGIQCFFCNNLASHRYVPSPRNQRIEGWWSFFSRQYASWWRNYFADLEGSSVLDMSSSLSTECLWFCFSGLIQRDLDKVRLHWNTHFIRRSRHNTVHGRPDSMFFMPDIHGGERNLLVRVPNYELNYAKQHIMVTQAVNEYQDYFRMVKDTLGVPQPENWNKASNLYATIMHIAEEGLS